MNKKSLFIVGMIAILILAAVGGYYVLTGEKPETSEAMAREPEATEKPVEPPAPTVIPAPTATPMPTESPAPTEDPASQDVEQVEIGLEVPEEVSITALDEYRYTTTDVALREKASVGSEKLDTVATSTKVHAIGITEDGQWVKVDGINGQEGFISAAYLQSTAPTTQQKQEVQKQQDQQAELEKRGEANTQQIQQQNQDKSLSEIQSDIMNILGAPNGDSLNNLPKSEYQGNQATGEHFHAQ